MRTTLDIDGKLLDAVLGATGEKTKSRAVSEASCGIRPAEARSGAH